MDNFIHFPRVVLEEKDMEIDMPQEKQRSGHTFQGCKNSVRIYSGPLRSL